MLKSSAYKVSNGLSEYCQVSRSDNCWRVLHQDNGRLDQWTPRIIHLHHYRTSHLFGWTSFNVFRASSALMAPLGQKVFSQNVHNLVLHYNKRNILGLFSHTIKYLLILQTNMLPEIRFFVASRICNTRTNFYLFHYVKESGSTWRTYDILEVICKLS